jgi:hypothetical protein
MRETQAIIERVRRVTSDLLHLELSVDPALDQLQPGQALLARRQNLPGWTPYLREEWTPVAARPGHLVIERSGGGHHAPGEPVSLLSPVGRPIPLRSGLRHLLLIAQAPPTPLVWLARRASADGVAITLVLGEAATRYPLELLPREVEILRSDTDWKWPDRVETLHWADQVIALAPPLTQAEHYGQLYDTISQLRHQVVPDGYVCGLFYHRLACGTGACQACQVGARGGPLLACTDGPALDLKQVKF